MISAKVHPASKLNHRAEKRNMSWRTISFGHLVDEQDDEDSPLRSKLREKIFVDLFWSEKIVILIDFFQLYGLLWMAAQPWPWPYLWTTWTRWTVYLNLDIFSSLSQGALAGQTSNIKITRWGEYEGYQYYAIAFVVSHIGTLLLLYALHSHYKKWEQFKSHFIAAALLISYLMYLPTSIAVFRLYYCEDSLLAADTTLTCLGSMHSTAIIVCTILYAPVFFGFPVIVYQYIADAAVYRNISDHEKRLQCWELSYLFSLDEFWLRGQLWLLSSFKRGAIYYRFDMMLFKAALLFMFIFVRSNLDLQGLLFTFFTVIFFLKYAVWHWPFRSASSNILSFVTLSALLTDTVFGMMNSFGVENAVMVASVETIWLLSFNAAALFFILLTCGYCFLSAGAVWPTIATLSRIRRTPGLALKAAKWVDKLREARTTKEIFLRTPAAVADYQGLEELLRILRKYWLSARSHGSIFEIPLQEVMEDLVVIHSRSKPEALRRFDYWDDAYLDAAEAGTFSRQLSSYPLMATRKKRVLLKLLAIRAIQSPGRDRQGTSSSSNATDNQQQQGRRIGDDGNRSRRLGSLRHPKRIGSIQPSPGTMSSRTVLDKLEGIAAAGGGGGGGGGDRDTGNVNGRNRTNENDDGGNLGEDESLLDNNDTVEKLLELVESLEIRSNAVLSRKHPPAVTDSDNDAFSSPTVSRSRRLEVDLSEIEECYIMWDDAINLYEQELLPGQEYLSDILIESWYTYRAALLEKLQEVEVLEQREQEEEQRRRLEIMEQLEKADRDRTVFLQQQRELEESVSRQRDMMMSPSQIETQILQTETPPPPLLNNEEAAGSGRGNLAAAADAFADRLRQEVEQSDKEYQQLRLDGNLMNSFGGISTTGTGSPMMLSPRLSSLSPRPAGQGAAGHDLPSHQDLQLNQQETMTVSLMQQQQGNEDYDRQQLRQQQQLEEEEERSRNVPFEIKQKLFDDHPEEPQDGFQTHQEDAAAAKSSPQGTLQDSFQTHPEDAAAAKSSSQETIQAGREEDDRGTDTDTDTTVVSVPARQTPHIPPEALRVISDTRRHGSDQRYDAAVEIEPVTTAAAAAAAVAAAPEQQEEAILPQSLSDTQRNSAKEYAAAVNIEPVTAAAPEQQQGLVFQSLSDTQEHTQAYDKVVETEPALTIPVTEQQESNKADTGETTP